MYIIIIKVGHDKNGFYVSLIEISCEGQSQDGVHKQQLLKRNGS